MEPRALAIVMNILTNKEKDQLFENKSFMFEFAECISIIFANPALFIPNEDGAQEQAQFIAIDTPEVQCSRTEGHLVEPSNGTISLTTEATEDEMYDSELEYLPELVEINDDIVNSVTTVTGITWFTVANPIAVQAGNLAPTLSGGPDFYFINNNGVSVAFEIKIASTDNITTDYISTNGFAELNSLYSKAISSGIPPITVLWAPQYSQTTCLYTLSSRGFNKWFLFMLPI
jgi:hypothetical protein